MIQRIQTIYLIAILIICGLLCSGSIVNMHVQSDVSAKDYVLNFVYLKVFENGQLAESHLQIMLMALVSAVIVWTIKVILDFKDLNKQIKNVKLNFLFIFLLSAGVFSTAALQIPGFNFSSLSMSSVFGIALLFFMMYLNLRAWLLMRKDNMLIKSADRIR